MIELIESRFNPLERRHVQRCKEVLQDTLDYDISAEEIESILLVVLDRFEKTALFIHAALENIHPLIKPEAFRSKFQDVVDLLENVTIFSKIVSIQVFARLYLPCMLRGLTALQVWCHNSDKQLFIPYTLYFADGEINPNCYPINQSPYSQSDSDAACRLFIRQSGSTILR
jgi:hypothetical protein